MTTTPHPSAQEKRRLRRSTRQTAQRLLDSDRVDGGIQVLAELRQKYGSSGDSFLKFGLAVVFLEHLMSRCCIHQASRVAYLLVEHLVCESWQNSRSIMMAQLAMWRRFRNTEAENACFAKWQEQNKN